MKPGYLTTEFWLTIIAGALTNLGTLDVPDRFKPFVTLGLIVGYAISRGLAKYESPPFSPIAAEAVDPVAVELTDQKAAVAAAKRRNRK
jgi:hypothetical protein